MIKRRLVLIVGLILAGCVGQFPLGTLGRVGLAAVPERLSDREFWKLSGDLSEPAGDFPFDNLISNEVLYQFVIPDLTGFARTRRAYIGVGPEQNFTYISTLKPRIAFVIDIRRGNLNLHLLYKALFELSADRPEFVSRLFSRPRPRGLVPGSSVDQIFEAFSQVEPSEELYQTNLKTVTNRLVTTHGFPLSADDLKEIDFIYRAFSQYGPRIRYSSTGARGARWPTYIDLMTAQDDMGETHSYLASTEAFAFVKDLETRNLLVPIVGNFAGPKAIRAVGQYLKANGTVVSAFYVSNVEQFLRQDGILDEFCANVATLPIDESSMFIRTTHHKAYQKGFGYGGRKTGFSSDVATMTTEVKQCAQQDR